MEKWAYILNNGLIIEAKQTDILAIKRWYQYQDVVVDMKNQKTKSTK